MYTWYVNENMDIQVYEGLANPNLICDFDNEKDAREHNVNIYNLKNEYLGIDKTIKAKLDAGLIPRCKYYIPYDYALAFMTLIGQQGAFMTYNSGTTNINVSDFLD